VVAKCSWVAVRCQVTTVYTSTGAQLCSSNVPNLLPNMSSHSQCCIIVALPNTVVIICRVVLCSLCLIGNLFLLGAEEVRGTQTASSNVTSSAAGAKPVVSMDRHTSDTVTSAAKSTSDKHHKTGASSSAHAQAPGGLFQRPIRPTQVEPNAPDLQSSSSAAKQSKPKQQLQQPPQQHAPIRPLMQNVPPARRLSLIA